MHVMRGRREAAERHGAGHVARCTARAAHGRPGLTAASDAPSPRVRPARHLIESSARPTWSSATSRPSPRVGRGSPTFPHCVGGAPPTRASSRGGCTSPSPADVHSRRIVGWRTTLCTDLAAGAPEMAVWQRKRAGADLTGLVHHLRPWGAVPAPSATGRPWPRPRRSPRWGPGRFLRQRAGRGTQAPLYKAEPIRNRLYPDEHGPWEGVDAASGRHRRAGPPGGHHPAPLRHWHTRPC